MSAELLRFAQDALGVTVDRAELLAGGGSERRFYRLRAGERTWVGAAGSAPAELRAFLAFTAHFAAAGIPVPTVHAAEVERGLYLMEDLGDVTLSTALREWRKQPGGTARTLAALRTVTGWLPVIQVRGGRGLDYSLCPEGRELARSAFEADIAGFLAHYVPRFVLRPGPDAAVRADLARLAARVDAVPREHFCYRDFQCRNVMWTARGPVFLDYQGGRRGPLQYDLASLLYSPDTGLAEPEREPLVEHYLAALAEESVRVERGPFLENFYAIVLIRRLQALGAYARLAVGQGKREYLDKIPPALETLRDLFARGRFALGLPALESWLREAIEAPTVH
jgi:aminoglycoside/choline kinase family phosphotransferase